MSTMYNVKNRSASMVVYRIPEDGIRREFQPGETKKISGEELEKLMYRNGGRELATHFLQIQDTKVTENLGIHTEPEYNMSEQDVIKLLTSTEADSLDRFLDALDFAPVGVIDLIKKYAVSLPLNDIQKREALKEKTGFDLNKALVHLDEEKIEDATETKSAATPGRRVQPATSAEEPAKEEEAPRTSNYKIVSKSEG